MLIQPHVLDVLVKDHQKDLLKAAEVSRIARQAKSVRSQPTIQWKQAVADLSGLLIDTVRQRANKVSFRHG